MSTPTTRRSYEITVISWQSQTTLVEAESREEAIEQGRRLWLRDEAEERFTVQDDGIDAVIADELA